MKSRVMVQIPYIGGELFRIVLILVEV